MGTVIYLFILLPVALCQNNMVSEQSDPDSKLFYLFREWIESMQNELQDTKFELRVYREQEQVDSSTLQKCNYHIMAHVQVEGYVKRLRAQGNKLWCTTGKTLQEYTQDLSLLKTVTLEGVKEASAVTLLPNGQLVVADDGELHLLHPNGSHIKSLQTKGWFTDVVSVQGRVHALRDENPSYEKSTMYSYNITGGKLEASGNIVLPHPAQRMSVFNDTLYLSYENSGRLFQYNTSSQLLKRLGQYSLDERETGQPGHLRTPILCSSDQNGNVLVADYDNYKLQVWSPKNDRWTVISLDRDSGRPIDAVVSGDTNTMWVVERKGSRFFIVKYTKQCQNLQ